MRAGTTRINQDIRANGQDPKSFEARQTIPAGSSRIIRDIAPRDKAKPGTGRGSCPGSRTLWPSAIPRDTAANESSQNQGVARISWDIRTEKPIVPNDLSPALQQMSPVMRATLFTRPPRNGFIGRNQALGRISWDIRRSNLIGNKGLAAGCGYPMSSIMRGQPCSPPSPRQSGHDARRSRSSHEQANRMLPAHE